MNKSDYLRILEDEGNAFIDGVCADLDGTIAHCDDWTNRALAAHLGMVWSIAATNVQAATTESTKPDDARKAPADDGEMRSWLEGRLQFALDELAAAEPSAPSWTFAADDQSAGFWQRRMAAETVVHRIDAQVGAGWSVDSVEPAIAAETIDEYTVVSLRSSTSRPNRDYPSESLHLHCTDTDGEWTMVGDGEGGVTVTRQHAKGDAAVRGRAHDLMCWIWGRPAGAVEIFGDPDVATAWQAVAP
ncbi:MAG: maleylpyruvate isomerase family mycothiol-dependent enzyme [Acidimicrobiales bacterium]